MSGSDSLSLYIHIPWCRVRCGYCDFNTYVLPTGREAGDSKTKSPDSRPAGPMATYLDAILEEVRLAAWALGTRWVTTVYFGGGTPTLMSVADYGRVLDRVRDCFDLVPDAEITTEANPETLTPELLDGIRATGVNRLSMGMQSAVPHVLATLDRVHTPGRVVEAAGWARSAGFSNLSLDLIYGTPGESAADWETSVDSALAMEPDHISAYSLIVEDGTPLARRMAKGELPYPDEDDLADKYCLADAKFSAAGLGWYEVSNWAKPGYECKHNLVYWHGDEWWGIGAGAHSFVGGRRWWNYRRPDTYESAVYQGSAVDGIETLTPEQARTESVMLGIRLAEGLDTALLTPSELAKAEQYVASGYLVRQGGRLVCTLAGRLIADLITREILD